MPPPNVTNLLSTLRAGIFNTLPVASNARTGMKYLRRRLRGPSALNYIHQPPSLKALNANVPWNKYAGWEGNASGPQAAWQFPAGQVVEDGFEEVPRMAKPGSVKKGKDGEKGKEGVAAWLVDPNEYTRFADAERRRRLGKGPPKKGQGKRSQLKKKK